MRTSYRLLPIVLFFIFYALIQVSFTSLRKLQEKQDIEETRVFQNVVMDRFQRYLKLPYMMAVLGSKNLAQGDIRTVNYETYASIVLDTNPEFLGFSVLDKNGVIIRAFPKDPNSRAIGKLTQNYQYLLKAQQDQKAYYFSPPFRLFQGRQGFVFYIPVIRNETHQGWYAVVISSEAFIQKFSLQEFIRLFNIVIIDEETGLDYFATSLEPNDSKVLEAKGEFYGRNIIFRTWRKENAIIQSFPWYFSVIFALILALAAGFVQRFYYQRKKTRNQLENISILLKVTSKEALNNLIEIHRELNELHLPEGENVDRLSRDIGYLTNLIEQIDLLQTMAHSREGLVQSKHTFLTLLKNQLDNFSDVLERKNIKIEYVDQELEAIVLEDNMWIFENSVLSNVFSHLMIYVESGATIKIEGRLRSDCRTVTFRARRIPTMNLKTITRRIDVAKKVLQLNEGDLKEEVTMDEIIVTIICKRPY